MEAALQDLLISGASRMGIELSEDAISRFETLLRLLQTWGRRINLTTRLETREIVLHHFLDSLAGVPLLSGTPTSRVIDLGAGAGFPAFPLKFALPGLRMTLAESVRKKVSFCREVIRATGCTDIEAVCARGETLAELGEHHRAYDWAVSRALGGAAAVLKLALPLVAPGGGVLLYKGTPDKVELDELNAACAKAGAAWSLSEVTVPGLNARRSLILVRLS